MESKLNYQWGGVDWELAQNMGDIRAIAKLLRWGCCNGSGACRIEVGDYS
jgi:hypothetical protein